MFYFFFWLAFISLFIGTAGYPIILGIWAKLKTKPVQKSAEIYPTISVVLPCRNDEKFIGAKINNLLSLNYPSEKLEVIIVSDGATDRTETIIDLLLPHPQLKYINLETSVGRAAALNAGVQIATGDILVFTNTKHELSESALPAIVRNFADSQVGGVCGTLLAYRAKPETGKKLSNKMAVRAWMRNYENKLKFWESKIHSVAGAYEALYAVRRELYTPVPASFLLDDLYLPFTVLQKGYRVVMEKEATAQELTKANKKSDVVRRQHTFTGKFQFTFEMPGLFSLGKNPVFWQFLLHKTIRLFFPFLIFILFIANLFIADSGFYYFTLLAQLLFYGLCLLGLVFRKPAFFYLFSRYNLVVLQAFYTYFTNKYSAGNVFKYIKD